MILDMSIRFPHFHIELNNIKKSISVFGYEITFYGMLLVIAILLAYYLSCKRAKKSEFDKEIVLDFAIVTLIASIVGARLLYVIFSWDEYKDNIKAIFDLRSSGMALYGALILGLIAGAILSKVKKVSFACLLDTCIVGIVFGQAIGRWGNFFNREAFGHYTDSFFAMQLERIDVAQITLAKDTKILENVVKIDGVEYIQVHPTFLYESLACIFIGVILILLEKYFVRKHKKFDGELTLIYFFMYGVTRIFIEQLRSDRLVIKGTSISVSLVLSVVAVVTSFTIIFYKKIIKVKILNNEIIDKNKVIEEKCE